LCYNQVQKFLIGALHHENLSGRDRTPLQDHFIEQKANKMVKIGDGFTPLCVLMITSIQDRFIYKKRSKKESPVGFSKQINTLVLHTYS